MTQGNWNGPEHLGLMSLFALTLTMANNPSQCKKALGHSGSHGWEWPVYMCTVCALSLCAATDEQYDARS